MKQEVPSSEVVAASTSGIRLTICLACYNRPDYAGKAIESLLSQTNRSFALLVSDNSTNEQVEEIVRRDFPEIPYVRRVPSTPVHIHGNTIVRECETEYIMIMHDDDELAPNFVAEMLQMIEKFPHAGCLASNAQIIGTDGATVRKYFYISRAKVRLITDPLWLTKRWFSYATLSVAPFPSYVYKKSEIFGMEFDNCQLSDFMFVHNCLQRGLSVAWLNKPIYRYRVHDSQDSARISFSSLSKLKLDIRASHPDFYASRDFRIFRAGQLALIFRRRGSIRASRKMRRIYLCTTLLTPQIVCRRLIHALLHMYARWHY